MCPMIYEICAIKGDFASRLEGIFSRDKSTWNTFQINGHHGASHSRCINRSSFVSHAHFLMSWGVRTSRNANRIVRVPKKPRRRYKKTFGARNWRQYNVFCICRHSSLCVTMFNGNLWLEHMRYWFDSGEGCVWNKDCRYGSSNIRLSGE